MSHQLNFAQLLAYDAGAPGISLTVTLALGLSQVEFPAKIDTGSTFCVFERAWGEALGLIIEDGVRERIGTVTGSFFAFGHSVTLTTAGLEFDALVFFATDESFTRNVLGRFGWLDRVVLGLVDYEGRLYLSRYDENYEI